MGSSQQATPCLHHRNNPCRLVLRLSNNHSQLDSSSLCRQDSSKVSRMAAPFRTLREHHSSHCKPSLQVSILSNHRHSIRRLRGSIGSYLRPSSPSQQDLANSKCQSLPCLPCLPCPRCLQRSLWYRKRQALLLPSNLEYSRQRSSHLSRQGGPISRMLHLKILSASDRVLHLSSRRKHAGCYAIVSQVYVYVHNSIIWLVVMQSTSQARAIASAFSIVLSILPSAVFSNMCLS